MFEKRSGEDEQFKSNDKTTGLSPRTEISWLVGWLVEDLVHPLS